MERILDLARWAPSGDNTQPWRFEVLDERRVVVHGFDTREHCVYDLDGRPSQISLGALLETMAVAATAQGLGMIARRRDGLPETTPTFDVEFVPKAGLQPDPLVESITRRSVQRRAMNRRRLTETERRTLDASVGADFSVVWRSGLQDRFQVACLMFSNAKLRLTLPEAYTVHRDIIEWNAQFSADRVPDKALGVDGATLRMMRFVMASWSRVRFFNTYMAGTLVPRLQMDLIPGIACAAHFWIKSARKPAGVDDFVAAGRAVQRFWLTATQLGLVQQPELTPLIFARYVRQGLQFTSVPHLLSRARLLEEATERVLGGAAERVVWMGRIGAGPQPSARSLRKELRELMLVPAGVQGYRVEK